VYAFGEVHTAYTPPSILHMNVEPASVEVKVNVAEVEFVGLTGDAVIVVFGGVTSTIQVYEAGVRSTFPAGSLALK
jgi:hypothetical protein